MPRRRATAAALAALALAVAAPGAHAAWFGPEILDAGVTEAGGIDLARDGSGAAVYVKPVDGVPHVFVSRLRDGAFLPPERVDAGIAEPGSDPVVAAASGGRLVVAWRSAGRVLAAAANGGPPRPPVVLGAAATEMGPPDADMAVQGTAHVVFSMDGNVHDVRLKRGVFEAVPVAFDVRPDQAAGTGAGRPRVALGADGNGVLTWAEDHPDGRRRVYARRVIGLRASDFPQEVSLPELNGAAGGTADSPDIAIEDDTSFAWVVWRQDIGGVSRSIARRLVGSRFEAPEALDGGAPSRAPRVAIDGDGAGAAVSQTDAGDVGLAPLVLDVFQPWTRVGGGATPLLAVSEGRDLAVAWGAGGRLLGRRADRDAGLEGEAALGAGTPAGDLAADAAGDFALALQAGDAVAVSVWDEPPRPASLRTSRAYKDLTQPELRWTPGDDAWGPLTHRVVLDGERVAETTADRVTPPEPLDDGVHRWYVETTDRRGQRVRTRPREVRVDTRPPRVRVAVRRAGRIVTLVTRVRDRASGPGPVRVDWGDGTTSAGPTHRYARPGAYTVTVKAADLAGNATRRRARVRVR